MSLSSQQHNYQASQGNETKKIFCAYHRTEFLTNFCLEKECLMPLCPSCVAEHTQQHYQASQKPTYINLNDGLSQVKQKCYSYIVSLQEYSKKNQELLRYVNNLTKDIHEQLTQIKQEIYVKIEQAFNRYEHKVIKQAEDYYRNNIVYDREEGQTIKQYIGQRIEILYDKIGMLKGDQCLAALIKFYDTEQKEYEFELKEVADYIGKHKKIGKAQINLNFEVLNQKFDSICQNLLVLGYASSQDANRNTVNAKKRNIMNSQMNQSITMTPVNKEKQTNSKVPIINETVRNSGIRNKGLQSRFRKIE